MKNFSWIASRNQRLSAMVHLPDDFQEGTPLVVCCHGFTGDKVGYNQLTLNLANSLEKSGYGVVRFDFLGSGDSDGDFSTDTFVAGWQEDLVNVLAWVKQQPHLTNSPIILYGHSLGGLVVLTHPNSQQLVAARIVFAPVTQAIANFQKIILGPELWQKSIAGERIANFFERGFSLDSQFVQDLINTHYCPIAAAAKLSTSLLVVHGTLDVVVPIQGSRDLYDQYQGDKEFVELEIDHGAVGAQEQLQTAIGDWLKKHFPVH
jgi:dipeptidyl aminopeptidase/acylaminoacyl peptidase